MKKTKGKRRFSLTLLFGFIAFCILFVSVALALGIVYVLTQLRWLTTFEGTQLDLMPSLLFMALISLIIGAGAVLLAGKIPMKPVNRFIDTINRLANGDFKARLSFGGPLRDYPVVKEVTDSFNAMAQELENTELLRKDFVNNFSHEFKTPIVSIAGFAKLLRRGNLTPEQQEEYLAIIEEESLRLADMATNMMSLTRIENQTILTDVTEYNLTEQLRACVLLLEDKWSRKALQPELPQEEYMIRGNEELLKQVWINLLDNAIKFSPNHSELLIQAEQTSDALHIHITNYGSEIPADKLPKIWNKFYQADESHASQGNGIGLAVVKQVVLLHNGSVCAKSQNSTTTFTVVLPKEQDS